MLGSKKVANFQTGNRPTDLHSPHVFANWQPLPKPTSKAGRICSERHPPSSKIRLCIYQSFLQPICCSCSFFRIWSVRKSKPIVLCVFSRQTRTHRASSPCHPSIRGSISTALCCCSFQCQNWRDRKRGPFSILCCWWITIHTIIIIGTQSEITCTGPKRLHKIISEGSARLGLELGGTATLNNLKSDVDRWFVFVSDVRTGN